LLKLFAAASTWHAVEAGVAMWLLLLFLPVLLAAKQLGCDDVSDAFRYGVGPKLPIGITQNGSSSI